MPHVTYYLGTTPLFTEQEVQEAGERATARLQAEIKCWKTSPMFTEQEVRQTVERVRAESQAEIGRLETALQLMQQGVQQTVACETASLRAEIERLEALWLQQETIQPSGELGVGSDRRAIRNGQLTETGGVMLTWGQRRSLIVELRVENKALRQELFDVITVAMARGRASGLGFASDVHYLARLRQLTKE
jgi:hypothetical protein